MYKFKSKYIVIGNSYVKHYNTIEINIDYKYQNSNLTFIEIHYKSKKCNSVSEYITTITKFYP